VVTPEAVVLELETAGVGSRLAAQAIDLGVLLLGFSLVVGVTSALTNQTALPDWVGVVVVVLAVAVVLVGYPVACEVLNRGRTLGKAALGLRVVTVEGAPVRLPHAAARAALSLVDLWLLGGAVAVVSVMSTRTHQRLGDLVAGTVVLRDRAAERAAVALAFHPPWGWEAWAAALDVSAVRAEDYTLIRSFLTRVDELSPEARAALATRIGVAVATRLRVRPPAHLSPEAFLACVAAAYQRRPAAAAAWGTMA
jgi:uncharacterized RDD family membrane protein YckC